MIVNEMNPGVFWCLFLTHNPPIFKERHFIKEKKFAHKGIWLSQTLFAIQESGNSAKWQFIEVTIHRMPMGEAIH